MANISKISNIQYMEDTNLIALDYELKKDDIVIRTGPMFIQAQKYNTAQKIVDYINASAKEYLSYYGNVVDPQEILGAEGDHTVV